MTINDDDMTTTEPEDYEGPADGANATHDEHDGGADGSADSDAGDAEQEGPADGGADATPDEHDGGADDGAH